MAQTGFDDLPDIVLRNIFYRLDIREQTCAAIAIDAFRDPLAEVPVLDIDSSIFPEESLGPQQAAEDFRRAVHRLISIHEGPGPIHPIRKFCIRYSLQVDLPPRKLYRWLYSVTTIGANELYIDIQGFHLQNSYRLPLDLFIRRQIRILQVRGCMFDYLQPHGYWHEFTELHTLIISHAIIESIGFSIMINDLPLLRILALINCTSAHIFLHAPHLEALIASGPMRLSLRAPNLCHRMAEVIDHLANEVGVIIINHRYPFADEEETRVLFNAIQLLEDVQELVLPASNISQLATDGVRKLLELRGRSRLDPNVLPARMREFSRLRIVRAPEVYSLGYLSIIDPVGWAEQLDQLLNPNGGVGFRLQMS